MFLTCRVSRKEKKQNQTTETEIIKKREEKEINSLGVLTVNNIHIPQTQSLRFHGLWETKIRHR